MELDGAKLNEFLFRRTPDFDKELAKDRLPKDYSYVGLYPSKTWPAFTGFVHTWDKVHVTVPNDDGNWEAWNIENDTAASSVTPVGQPGTLTTTGEMTDEAACGANGPAYCDPNRVFVGWGSTRSTYYKFHRDYQTPVFCFDRLRHVEEAVGQLAGIVDGLKKLPNEILSTFLRKQSVWTADKIYICNATYVDTSHESYAATFPTSRRIQMESASYLPTSKLTMQYINHYLPQLMYAGYHDQQFLPEAKFEMMTDITTAMELGNANPALLGMYQSADFAKGGKYFQFGAMMGVGNVLMHVDATPLRFYHIGGGLFQEVVPYKNVSATIGKKPQFDTTYEKAPYQLYHIYNRKAREVHMGDITSVNPDMPFGMGRSLNGKWSWKNPDSFYAYDPLSGSTKYFQNDKKNKGYFLGEYELGVKTNYPEIEMWILALRESGAVADVPRAASIEYPDALTASTAGTIYQYTLPYNGSPGYLCID